MSLTALEGRDDVDEELVHEHLDGNLCRCTGYQNIKKAACRALLHNTAAVEEAAR